MQGSQKLFTVCSLFQLEAGKASSLTAGMTGGLPGMVRLGSDSNPATCN